MDEVSVIGVDVAKRSQQLCAVSASGEIVWEKRLSRSAFQRLMQGQRLCVVGIEACGGAFYWARLLREMGHRVKLMAPSAVKPYRSGKHKNDRRDARAVAEAASRSAVAGVAIKSEAARRSRRRCGCACGGCASWCRPRTSCAGSCSSSASCCRSARA